VKAKTFCSKVLIAKKYFFNINLLSKISHFFKKMKFSNFKALYIKFDASLKLENHVKRCVYVSIFKLFFFSIMMQKSVFTLKKTFSSLFCSTFQKSQKIKLENAHKKKFEIFNKQFSAQR
jgi:hypothetical protein